MQVSLFHLFGPALLLAMLVSRLPADALLLHPRPVISSYQVRTSNGSTSVRLVNGTRSSEGRVEVLMSIAGRDVWTSVCGTNLDTRDARVICRSVGFPSRGSRPAIKASGYYGHGTSPLVFFHCEGGERSLRDCPEFGVPVVCAESDAAGVDCQPFLSRVSRVRLVGGRRPTEGRLEVYQNRRWGTVCDDGFDVDDARVACRMLGYSGIQPVVRSNAYFGQGSGNILLDDVDCRGSETNLGDCSYTTNHNCIHREDVGVDCLPVSVMSARLVNGSRPSEGRLEVNRNGTWGTVCDDSFGINDARVACRMLGYSGMQPVVRGSAFYGQGSGTILMDDVDCGGSETNLGQCLYRPNHNCGHYEDVGINCRPGVSEVRLASGSRSSEGRLEVLIGERWGTVCDDSFGVTEATVACRMLGYTSRASPLVRGSAYFGQGSGDVLMDDVSCRGNETNIGHCSFLGSLHDNCGHHEDVGIDCQPPIHVGGVRLVGGRQNDEGRLEVQINGQWGTVCDDSFGTNDAMVACRMLRLTGSVPVVRSSAYYGQGSGSILMDDVNCLGTENNLGQCAHTSQHNCGHNEDVGIACHPPVSRVRLVGGSRASEGRLEVLRNTQWGTVCDDGFDVSDARVVCRMLGYSSGNPIVRGSAHYGEGSGSIFLDDVNCHGNETSLGECSFISSHNCGHSEDVGVDCNQPTIVESVRLVNGSTPYRGRLEVLSGGQWGTVCDDLFDVNDATVVCRMLGSYGSTPTVRSSAYYGRGTGNILLDDVMCMGSETSLASCQFRSQHNCGHHEDVGIECRPFVSSVRLVGGSSSSEGRLEVQMDGQWGTVCDDHFDVKDARVACRMLGYYSSLPAVRSSAHYGQGSGNVLMDDVVCNGRENNLGYCSFRGHSEHNCGHSEDVGLQCQPTVSDVRLVNGGKPSQGRLEVLINGRWGTVCDDGFTSTDARVVCQMLGHSGYSVTVKASAYYGQGTGDIVMDDVSCTGSESHLSQCTFTDSNNHNCGHYEDVGIICTTTVTSVRLVNGSRPSEGRVEVQIGGMWGTVCDDGFNVNDATVVCRMLGYTGTTPVVMPSAHFGQGVGEIQMDDLGCTGNESNLGQCSHVSDVHHNCGHHEDVGVCCQPTGGD